MPITDLDLDSRERLSGQAFGGFVKLAELWRLRTDEQIDLLGASLSRETLANWVSGAARIVLSGDQLERVSLLLGIYEALERTWRRAPVDAEAWIRRPRSDGPFGGTTPVDFMRAGGLPALVATRAYVDGIAGGAPSPRADIDYADLLGLDWGRITTTPSILDLADAISNGDPSRWPALYARARTDRAVRQAIMRAAALGDSDYNDCARAWYDIADCLEQYAKDTSPRATDVFGSLADMPAALATPEAWLDRARDRVVHGVLGTTETDGEKRR